MDDSNSFLFQLTILVFDVRAWSYLLNSKTQNYFKNEKLQFERNILLFLPRSRVLFCFVFNDQYLNSKFQSIHNSIFAMIYNFKFVHLCTIFLIVMNMLCNQLCHLTKNIVHNGQSVAMFKHCE